jgi:hypothetical protein
MVAASSVYNTPFCGIRDTGSLQEKQVTFSPITRGHLGACVDTAKHCLLRRLEE